MGLQCLQQPVRLPVRVWAGLAPFLDLQLVELVKAATGWDFSIDELLKIGERTVNLQRIFNLREGFSSAQDGLPKKLFKARKGGKTDGLSIPPEQVQQAIQSYYQMAGWDERGVPHNEKLEELGLSWAVG